MKAAVVALACVLRLAVSAQADEVARPQQSSVQTLPAAASPPPALRPWVDPGSAEPISDGRLPAPQPAAATPVKAETVPAHDPAKVYQDSKAREGQAHEGQAHEGQAREGQTREARGGQRPRQCLNAVETRQTITARRLTEPFRALRAGRQQGEALRAKLCKWKQDQFVYEVFVLRRDGRIVRVYMNAQNGQSVGALEDH